MIKSLKFNTRNSGPHLLVYGAVHGNEKCGTNAILKIVEALKAKHLVLHRGNLTLVPIVNHKASEENKRYIDFDLNRIIDESYRKDGYEYSLVPIIRKHVQKADYLLDLHSFSANGPSFVFLDSNDNDEKSWAISLGTDYIIKGWEKMENGKYKTKDTTSYAHSVGKKSLTIECGSHHAEASVDVAYQAIVNSLEFLNMAKKEKKFQSKKARIISMSKVYMMQEEGKFIKNWKNFDECKKDQVIAHMNKGKTEIKAPYDGFIIMPNVNALAGEEWFYLGKR